MARAARTDSKPVVPLGSLTQPGARSGLECAACGSERVIKIGMSLTDGSEVEFVSCHACEHRVWVAPDGHELPVSSVLDMTRKRT